MLVLSLSYFSLMGPFFGIEKIIADQLVETLLDSARWHLTHPQRIVLVGYGIGGLVIKYFLAQVDKVARGTMLLSSTQGNCKAFQENLEGIVFYAVPHSGSSEDFAKYMKFYKNPQNPYFSNLSLESFRKFPQLMEELDSDFRYSIKGDTIIMAIVEGCPMGQEVLVPDTSAQMLAGKMFLYD
ncbi:unnamed protein product [Sphagnum jensenii]|uniref:DUF676 domain-containing protein n=1 Tax=Sphagnum jensenii TaxID=128206 RepID=A0ABP1B2Z9_9BRYO